MLVFNKYFYKKNKSKLYFGDRVAVLNDFIYQTGGSTCTYTPYEKKIRKIPQDHDCKIEIALFVWLISHQPAILFSQNKSASSTFLSEQISTSHQPPAKRTDFR
jgi:hypothetical protein